MPSKQMEVWQQLLCLVLAYTAHALMKRLILNADTTGPSSCLLHPQITAQTEMLNKDWKGESKIVRI